MTPFALSTIIFGVFSSCLAIDSHLDELGVTDDVANRTPHHFSKRQVILKDGFPALGGIELAGKVFTTTGSRVTQSRNLIRTRNRKTSKFIGNPQGKPGTTATLNVLPTKPKVTNDRTLLTPETESSESNEAPILITESSPDEKPDAKDSTSDANDSKESDQTFNLIQRGLIRRSLFTRELENDGLTSPADDPRYMNYQVIQSQRKLGEFPPLGGLKGTVSAQEAEKAAQAAKLPPGATTPGNPKLSDPQASRKFVLQPVE